MPVDTSPACDARKLVLPDRVHRSVYTDPGIFELEMTRLFGRAWIYLGHDSQIPRAGQFFTTRIGREPVLVVRQDDGSIRALFNRCAHKGMQLWPDDLAGEARLLRCSYHGWTYRLDGSLRTLPAESGYAGSCVARGATATNLVALGGFESYRGFLFGRVAATGPALLDWLGPMRSSLDNFVDRAPDDRVEVAGGVLRYLHDCNWKFFLENTLDAMHPMVAHQSAIDATKRVNSDLASRGVDSPFALQMMLPFGASYAFYDDMGQRGTRHGHGDLGNAQSLHSGYGALDDYAQRLAATRGADRAREILQVSRNNSVLYPSVMFKAPVSLLRIIRPIAVDRTVLETWHFRLCGAPDELLARTVQYSTVVNSSAGPVGPDDHAAYRRLQSGLGSSGNDWVMLARHLGQERPDAEGALASRGTSEFVHRNQFAAWVEYLSGEDPA